MYDLFRSKPIIYLLVFGLALAAVSTLIAWLYSPHWYQLGAFFWYFIPGSYLTNEPALIYGGSLYGPAMIMIVAGLSTLVAATMDFFIVRRLFELRGASAVKHNAVYRMAIKWFYKRP